MVVRENVSQIAEWGAQDTILVSASLSPLPISPRLRGSLASGRMQAVYLPGDQDATPFRDLLLAPNPTRFIRILSVRRAPVTDDRPFFFYTSSRETCGVILPRPRSDNEDYKINRAVPLLFGLVAREHCRDHRDSVAPSAAAGQPPSTPAGRGWRAPVYFLRSAQVTF